MRKIKELERMTKRELIEYIQQLQKYENTCDKIIDTLYDSYSSCTNEE